MKGYKLYETYRLPNGRQACIYPLTFGRARLGVGDLGHDIETQGFDDIW